MVFFRKHLDDHDVLLEWEVLLSDIAPNDLANIRYHVVDSVMISPDVLFLIRPASFLDRNGIFALKAPMKRAVVAITNLRELVVVFHVKIMARDPKFRGGKGQLMLMEGNKICAIEDNEIVRSSDLRRLPSDTGLQDNYGQWTTAPIRPMYGWLGKNGLHLNERGYLDVM